MIASDQPGALVAHGKLMMLAGALAKRQIKGQRAAVAVNVGARLIQRVSVRLIAGDALRRHQRLDATHHAENISFRHLADAPARLTDG